MSALGNKEILAANLRYYIERSGKTQKDFAEIVGVKYSTFNDWINAKKYPRIDKIEMLAAYFGIQKSDLIEEKEKPTAVDDGLSKDMQKLIDRIKVLPEDKIRLLLQVAESIE